MKDKSIKEIYSFIMEYEIISIENEEKIRENLFKNLTDEQEKYFSELKFRYFRLGYEIAKTLKNFRNGGNHIIE